MRSPLSGIMEPAQSCDSILFQSPKLLTNIVLVGKYRRSRCPALCVNVWELVANVAVFHIRQQASDCGQRRPVVPSPALERPGAATTPRRGARDRAYRLALSTIAQLTLKDRADHRAV